MINECYMSWLGLVRNLQANNLLPQLQDQIDTQESVSIFDRKIYYTDDQGQEHCLFVQPREFAEPGPQPYASWTWDPDLKNWQPPVSRPASPKHSYDLLWNEDTQKWGLTGININKIGEDGERYAVKRKYFNDWEKLQEYLYKINTVKYVHDQIAQQLLQPLKDRKIISPATDAAPGKTDYICLEMIE